MHPSLSSTLFLRIFRLQVRSSYPPSDERKEKREKDSQFERKKETKTNRYRGIGLVWPYIQRVSSGWDRWLMHSREDGMEILSRETRIVGGVVEEEEEVPPFVSVVRRLDWRG